MWVHARLSAGKQIKSNDLAAIMPVVGGVVHLAQPASTPPEPVNDVQAL